MVLWSLGFAATLAFGLGFATVAGFPAARVLHFVMRCFVKILKLIKPWNRFPLSGFWWDVHYGWPTKHEWRHGEWLLTCVGSFALAFFVWLIVELPAEQATFFFAMLLIGMFLSLVVFGKMCESYEPWPRRALHRIDIRMRRYTARKRSLIVASMVGGIITAFNLGTLLDLSATFIGFRQQNVSVRLAKEDFDELIEQATREGVAINPCEDIPAGSSVLRHADILWQSLGTQSLLRFPSLPLGISPKDTGTIRLKTTNASLGGVVAGGAPTRCRELLADTLFHEGTAELRPSGATRIVEQLPWVRNRPAGWKVRVVAHTDQGAGTSEAATALRQALIIKTALETALKLPAGVVEVGGAKQSAAKLDCTTHVTVQRSLCDKANRRVRIILYEPG